jgi:hypothetical protein
MWDATPLQAQCDEKSIHRFHAVEQRLGSLVRIGVPCSPELLLDRFFLISYPIACKSSHISCLARETRPGNISL